MNEEDLKRRTKQFALRVLKVVDALPKSHSARNVGSQLSDSGTSVGANYRSACRGRSRAEFIAKLGIVEEEADESAYWLEIIMESGMLKPGLIGPLHQEATELTKIIRSSRLTAIQRTPPKPARANRKSPIENQK